MELERTYQKYDSLRKAQVTTLLLGFQTVGHKLLETIAASFFDSQTFFTKNLEK